MKIDWFQYNEGFDKLDGYRDCKMLSIYDHYLNNKEAESMVTYVHIESKIISIDAYQKAEQKFLNFFEKLYEFHNAFIFDIETKSLLNLEIKEYLGRVKKACREMSQCIIVLPKEKVVFISTYDLMFAVLFYSDAPLWLTQEVSSYGLYLLE